MNTIKAVFMYKYLVNLLNIDRSSFDLYLCFYKLETFMIVYFRIISRTRITNEATIGYGDLWMYKIRRSNKRRSPIHTARLINLEIIIS